MKLNRRHFLASTTGALVSAAALSGAVALQSSATQRITERRVISVLRAKFPHLDVDQPVVRQFVASLAARDLDAVGPSLTTVREALDPRRRTADFERLVCQEFAAGTNYLEAGRPGYPGLKWLAHEASTGA